MNPLSTPSSVERQVRCWCGNARLEDFSPDYWRCPDCQTLVLRAMHGEEISHVRDDDRDFYGKNYYLHHIQEDYGLPDLETRTRTDLPERCLHWLRTLLKFVPGPGARTLELGCGHGGFVAMQRWAGLDATGLELSPWVVGKAREWFGVPVLEGRLEDQHLPPASLDAVILMDVLEHLPDPRATLGRAVALLRNPGSFLLIQTPCYPAGVDYETLRAQNHPFLTQLKPQEHLYLFSEQAVTRLCAELDVGQMRFEPAIYAHYDLFAVASAGPLTERALPERTQMLLAASPPARWTLAMLDLAEGRDDLSSRLAAATAESADLRGKALTQNDEVTRLHGLTSELFPKLDAAENVRNLATAQLADLRRNFESVEADHAARGQVIARQGEEISRLHAEVDHHLQTAADFWPRLDVALNERNLLAAQMEDLRAHFAQSEADRDARLQVIATQDAEINRLHAEVDRRLHESNLSAAQLADLRGHFETVAADSAARLRVIESQGQEVSRLHAVVHDQGTEINRLHAEVDHWLREAGELRPRLEAAQHESNLRAAQLADLRGHFENSEADRAARLEVIIHQGETVSQLQAQLAANDREHARLAAEIGDWQAAHGELQTAHNDLQTTHSDLQASHDHLQAAHGDLLALHDELYAAHDDLQTAHGGLRTTHAALAGDYEGLRTRKKTLDRHWTVWLLKRLRLWPL